MFIAIVQHTPGWVWGLLAVLIALGLSQTRDREASVGRVTVLPVAMVSLSLFGVIGVFGPTLLALGTWAVGMAVALLFGQRAVALRGARWSARTRRLALPGSWLPLGLILALFVLKYSAGVSLGLHPSLRAEPLFAGGLGFAYGLFSGLFLARALSLRAVLTGRSRPQPA